MIHTDEIRVVKTDKPIWVEIANLSVYVTPDRGGVVRVLIYEKGHERERAVAQCWAVGKLEDSHA